VTGQFVQAEDITQGHEPTRLLIADALWVEAGAKMEQEIEQERDR